MNPEFIIIHHSSTKDDKTVSWGAIRKYHMETNGWRAIGYHWGLEDINGNIETLMGRLMDEDGAHCKDGGMNSKSIGICCVGNFDNQVPTIGLIEKLIGLVEWIRTLYNIPKEKVIGHREAQAMAGVPENQRKTCPGLTFDMNKLRNALV